MADYAPPLRDLRFALHEVLRTQDQAEVAGYADMTEDLTGAVLEEAGKIARDILAPLNVESDHVHLKLENGVVRTPESFKTAFDALREGGWTGLDCAEDYGGQGMPYVLNSAVGEMQSSAAMAFMMYPGLSHGVYSAISVHGSEELKNLYLPKIVSGAWTGTMNLTEPHCGTDLALLRTKAEPDGDGSYRISGQKIFISAGEHDLAENIAHLVLARIPGGPEGVKGISLFVVPKFIPKADGSLGARNSLSCGKLEEKMGIHGNSTCVMNYDEATGWLVGAEHKGLNAMFTMMNEARLMVGMQGLSQGAAAYQHALAYAKDRRQGRALTGPVEPDKPADKLMVHPDVRRMLMEAKSFVEGGRLFFLWAATLIDAEKRHADPAEREKAGLLVALLTPVVKGFLTDKGFETAVNMQQIFGGHGYVEETGASQFVRDARIAMIYEGANGVQALDLIGRKLPQKGGAAMQGLIAEIKGFLKANEGDEELKAQFLDPLKAASKDMQEALMFFLEKGMKNPNDAAAGSTDFLHLMGHVALAYSWARAAVVAKAALAAGTDEKAFYEAKLATGRYYMQRQAPETAFRLARIRTGSAPLMALADDAF
ncbi:acyl-CoA dehydrogenase C-terminal domain-containing protein [Neomegalonema sp.]|uniref:acyl-CoA dehydrogenase C-terminal domain-containing protein n=1 Tax=Neomegalonema sp. TaxID=2039713 RepID=UPI00260EB2FB|nr:acyl-CoA dehydrogenase C-terminal domain-containing protein [Neomegalonema sp.]MDD2870202.1 acyl-CoA dehydrogenase C-terminal domain-containing protein [Neomegalonema sp.]